jgi:hypothetical protein
MFRVLILCTAALAIAACATPTPTPTPPSASNATAQKTPCVPEATRLPQTNCGPGSVYDQKDLNSTGQPTPGPALNMLDPRITSQ